MVKEIKNIQDFAQAVGDKNTGLVVIDFYGDWCGPCKAIAPKYEAFVEKYPDVDFYKLNVDEPETEKIVGACEIAAMPTFCFFIGGEYKCKSVGADINKLETMINQNIPVKDLSVPIAINS